MSVCCLILILLPLSCMGGDATQTLFSNIADDVMFDECLISTVTARSELDCARRCSSDPNCKTFTFTKVSCGVDADCWTVFQRRQDGTVDFYRGLADYVNGFGSSTGECWLGLETLHSLTSSGNWTLRIDLGDWEGNTAYATYTGFYITNNTDNYR
nr:hypothetical protein BaRGS_016774 [Batillaria attramentaria]